MKIKYRIVNKALQIKLCGELDESTAQKARADIDTLIDSNAFAEVVFDFSEVHFMDSTGIGMLLGRFKKLNKMGCGMYIKNPTKQADKILYMSGLYEIIKKIEESDNA